ncbi:MAG: alpha-galactosidase [Candidatus Sumerlaeia bacterium]|nr:alpha-galactosidase [Candidatus Sumerlaeia bacterium]
MKNWKTQATGDQAVITGGIVSLHPVFADQSNGTVAASQAWSEAGGKFSTKTTSGLSIIVASGELSDGRLRLSVIVTNSGDEPIPLHEMALFRLVIPGSLDRVLLNGREMNSRSDLCIAGKVALQSSCVAGYTNSTGTRAVVVGWEDPSGNFTWVNTEPAKDGSFVAHAMCDREGILLKPGEALEFPPILVHEGEDLWELMRTYALTSARACGAKPSSDIMTGWCSWYSYYGTESVGDILANVKALRDKGFGGDVKTIQIDDGWNLEKPGAPRVWGDWEAGAKFPQGMKWIADQIRSEGFLPGLWLAPFSVDPASNFFKDHPDLLVKGDDGNPRDFWGVYALDLTNPRALDFVRSTFERVFNEWGFAYIKIDFLLHAIQPGRRYDQSVTTAQALRNGLKAIREVAGDRFILGCGCPMGPALGIVDAMRIGPDVSHRWYIPMNLGEWPVGNCSVYSGAVHTVWRHWMHGTWWQNDPDCILVHDQSTEGEKHEFQKIDNGAFATEPSYGLTNEEAGFWVRLIWMSGSMGMVGENPDYLNESRLALLRKAFPIHGKSVRWMGGFEDPRVARLVMVEDGKPTMIGLFNLTDSTQSPTVNSLDGMEMSARLVEWLTGEEVMMTPSAPQFPDLPPRSGRIWKIN